MWKISVEGAGPQRRITISRGQLSRTYGLTGSGQGDYLDFLAAVAGDFGTRVARNRLASAAAPDEGGPCAPLLSSSISSEILYGYGDPSLLWVPEEGCWYLTVTSNDAPHSFPILRSHDLEEWTLAGFAFPAGAKPAWAAEGKGVADYWAPELHRVGGEYWLCFSAREKDGSLSIGLSRSDRPEGPFAPPPEPLLRGGVIDAHIFVGDDGPILFWKEDSNGVWPRLLAELIERRPELAEALFEREEDRRTASLTAALWIWGHTLAPMEQFFLLQPLIEACVARFGELRNRLQALEPTEADLLVQAMRTAVFGQRLSLDGARLVGERHIVLVNDLEWEGHLIEGPWVTEQQGRYYLFYSGNDFSTAEYGIGVAVADAPFGPYRKAEAPLLRSNRQWAGPGHCSVAPGPDGRPHLFLHAYFPDAIGYKAFRALLRAPLRFHAEGVEVGEPRG